MRFAEVLVMAGLVPEAVKTWTPAPNPGSSPGAGVTALLAEPGSDVVDGRAKGAGAKRRPERAEHHRGLCALYQMLVYQMSHGCDSSR
jgi:hypothetical protein